MSAERFGFPFPPYSVQIDFINSLISVLENGQVGIFESPTGTGKSMSLLCGALTWLKEHQRKFRENLEIKAAFQPLKSNADDWLSEHTKWKVQQDEATEAKKMLQRLEMHDQKRQKWRNKRHKRRREDDDEEELLKLLKSIKQNVHGSDGNIEDELDASHILDYKSDDEEIQEEEDEDNNMTKIYYCSRTHSQLSQFVQEVKRSSFSNDVRLVSLASRESLCVNEIVLGLRSINLINERCLDLQKKTGPCGKKGCSFKKEASIDEFSDHILAEIQDVEELAKNGRMKKSCPYYATRFAAKDAELIVLPYNTLLHSSTRNASGLKLKDSIVIIDEAHNLMETIVSVHTVILGGSQISRASNQLNQYFSRYRTRLNPQNVLYVKQLIFVLGAFFKFLLNDDKKESKTEPEETVVRPMDFLTQTGIDNINLFKLIHYCEKSRISQKLHGFSVSNAAKLSSIKPVQSKLTSYLQKLNGETVTNEENENPQKEGSPFVTVQEFLRALTSASKDGCVICKRSSNTDEASMKFLLLNPASQFDSIVKEARAVVLAGGTMHPHSEFIDRLLIPSGVTADRISQFSCGHVVPKENLLALALSKGTGGKRDLDFTYGSRGNCELIEEAGRTILNLSVLVPGGMVVFFPSYEYEQYVYSCWERSGLLIRLNGQKRVFREPRKSSQLEPLLANYARCISDPKPPQTGAILLSIVGGKMSEGINFSNDLGRCVVMLGMPFPNIHSVEFKQKSSSLEAQLGPGAANAYGHILCMRAVNQSIGRAIRHRADYAAIILMDIRYQKPSVQAALPEWIRESLQNCDSVGPALGNIKKFFALHKAAKTST